MKYGILFGIVAVLLTVTAIMHRGWCVLCLWPAASFATISSGYLVFGPRVYGKSTGGVLATTNTLVLLPYLLYSWAVWHLLRVLKTEPAFDQLDENIFIGRRLLAHECPEKFDHVIDLTCEFSEPEPLRQTDYHSFQILDGFVPTAEQLRIWIAKAVTMKGTVYIHCAEGHGRTGLFAAALLFKTGQFDDVDQALDFVTSKRPLVRLGDRQRDLLARI